MLSFIFGVSATASAEDVVENVAVEIKDASEGAKKLKNLSAKYNERFVQWRTAYSDWRTYGQHMGDGWIDTFSDSDLSQFLAKGATIYFRLNAEMGELDTETWEYEPKKLNYINKSNLVGQGKNGFLPLPYII